MPRDRPFPGEDPVMVIGRRPTPPTPAPASYELLAEILDRVTAMQKAQADHRTEVLARLDALDRAVFRAEDAAGCANSAVVDLRKVTREWLEEIMDVIDPLDDDEDDE